MAKKILEIKNLTYFYRKNFSLKTTTAVQNISFSIQEGEIFGFLGHNGAGKTTTIKCILNLLRPKRGEIIIAGNKLHSYKERNIIGYVPEYPYFYQNLTVKETIYLLGNLYNINKSQLKKEADRIINLLKLTSHKHKKISSLSKGLTQRVAIAQAILHKPKLLILDEPFSGLDPIGRVEIKNILYELNQKHKTTILLSTHLLSDIESICSQALMMAKGKIVTVAPLKNLNSILQEGWEIRISKEQYNQYQEKLPLNNPKLSIAEDAQNILITSQSYDVIEEVLKACLNLNIKLINFSPKKKSLEQLYMEVISKQQ